MVSLPRPRNYITTLRRRREAGETLTPQEDADLKAYWRRYNKQKPSIHLSEDENGEWRSTAAAEGLSLSDFIKVNVKQARRGDSEQLADLRREAEEWRARCEVLEGLHGKLAVEHTQCAQRAHALEPQLKESVERLLESLQEAGFVISQGRVQA